MATPKRAFATKLYRETTPGSGTYTAIGGLTNLNWPALITDSQESTDMDATSAFRTHEPTLNSLGDCTGELNYDSSDATQEQIQADQVAQTKRNYKIIGTDAGDADWAFEAFWTRFEIASQRDGLMVAAFTLKPTGVVTRT